MKQHPEQPSTPWPRIAAVVVTYQPDAVVLDNLRRLCAQVSPVIVVDNGSQGASAQLVETAGTLPGVRLIRNHSNLGIATALNIGIRHALQGGSQWVATFDQDSAITEGFFEKFFDAWNACPVREQVGMIVPGHWAYDAALETKQDSTAPLFAFVTGAPTSGSVIKAEVFQATGFYDDSLFIDYVDTDSCLRLLKGGFKILSATQAAALQSATAAAGRRSSQRSTRRSRGLLRRVNQGSSGCVGGTSMVNRPAKRPARISAKT